MVRDWEIKQFEGILKDQERQKKSGLNQAEWMQRSINIGAFRLKTFLETEKLCKKISPKLKVFIDGYHLYRYVKNEAERTKKLIDREKQIYYKEYKEAYSFESKRKIKDKIKLLDKININERVLASITSSIFFEFSEKIDLTMKNWLNLNEKKNQTRYICYLDIESLVFGKDLDMVNDSFSIRNYENEIKKTLEDFRNKNRKKPRTLIEFQGEYQFFFATKPNLKILAESYRKQFKKLNYYQEIRYKKILTGIIPNKSGNDYDTNLYSKYTDFISNMNKGFFGKNKKIKYGITRADWSKNHQYIELKEKGVDCKLIIEVMKDVHRYKNNFICLLTNDSDYYPLIKEIKYNFQKLDKNYPLIYFLTPQKYQSKILKKQTISLEKGNYDYMNCFAGSISEKDKNFKKLNDLLEHLSGGTNKDKFSYNFWPLYQI